jgi:hypothetical protein
MVVVGKGVGVHILILVLCECVCWFVALICSVVAKKEGIFNFLVSFLTFFGEVSLQSYVL